MPTYVQLATESVWIAQYTPPALLNELIVPLRAHFDLGPNSIGAAGNNNHLSGRHRSYAWDVGSRYCTDRGYGTTDGRDQTGDRNWYRAVDVGITGQALFDASRRLDAAVRAGRLPGVAEWFGTFDGVRVVGWFQGSPSTSDSSHLTHLHLGFWNSTANDAALMRLAFDIITATDGGATTGDDDMPMYLLKTSAGHQYRGDGLWYAPINTGAELAGWENLVPADRRFAEVDLAWWGRDVTTVALAGAPGGGSTTVGLTEKQVEDAAYRGAQRAEDS